MGNIQQVLCFYKKVGETPLEALDRLRIEKPEYAKETLTYAGRLDPLAEGLLLVLAGEEVKNKEKYLNLDKTYTFEILFGFETDTLDVLGKLVHVKHPMFNIKEELIKVISDFVCKFAQQYPAYSSKTVNGKPLFEYAREGNLDEIEIPTKQVEIYSLEAIGSRTLSTAALSKEIQEKIKLVKGDFRQEEILKLWQENIAYLESHSKTKNIEFFIPTLRARVSSGTYIRSLVDRIGKKLGTYGLAFSIKRERVGKYSI